MKNKCKPSNRARAESRASEKFDEQVFNLKLSVELSDLPINFVDAINRTLLDNHETGADWSPRYFVDTQLALLRERRLVGADRVGREVWQIHLGELITPEFIRKILVPKALEQIATVEAYISDARATGNVTWEPEWEYLMKELGKLKSETVNNYGREIEELAKPAAKPGVYIPGTWEELRKRNSISRKDAANMLKCDLKTVSRRIKDKSLTRSQKGRIVCNERLKNEIRKVHGEQVLR